MVVDREVINFRAAGVVFLIVIGFPEIVGCCAGFTGCGGYFHIFPNCFNIVERDLGGWSCEVVRIPVFLDKFKGVFEILDRFARVVFSFIAFPVN